MAADEIGQFMAAIRQIESGGNYQAVGVPTRYGRALGAYQIMQTNWDSWARQAGIPGADWRDQAAQDHVARHKMLAYYRQFGSWDLVAIAWFAGPGRARTAAQKGISSVGGLSDVLGTTVAGYVRKMRNAWGSAPPVVGVAPDQSAPPLIGDPEPDGGPSPADTLRGVFEAVSNIIAGGQRMNLEQIKLRGQATELEAPEPEIEA